MTRYSLICLLLGAMAWSQAATPAASPGSQKQAAQSSGTTGTTASTLHAPEASKVAPDAPVITVKGLCEQASAKAAAHECNTVITRAEFEKVVEAVQPDMPARMRRQFARRYANALAMSIKAEQMGLDKGPSYEEHMKLARIQVLNGELNKKMQAKASQITETEIADYYKKNSGQFEEAETNRIYIPKTQQPPQADKDDQLGEEEQQKGIPGSEQTMKEEADKLRARAAAGEDFNKLQSEAYQVAGLKLPAPDIRMGKIRRNTLPASQASIMDLQAGDVSPVISDQSGYFIYKLVSKATTPLDQAREEIVETLRAQRLESELNTLQESTKPTLDEAYFGPEKSSREPRRPAGSLLTPPQPTAPGPN